jgi:TetR/AcrR family fatty acid metabolism transcriptional regulator
MNIHSVLNAPARPIDRPERTDKRIAILRAAIDVFAGSGYFNAQVADVARAAGVAAGTVYLYFRSKDDLLVSIFERTMKEAIEEVRRAIAPIADPVGKLKAIARVHLDRVSRDRNLAIVFQVELRQSTKFMERFSATTFREYLGMIRQVIVEGQTAGAFRTDINATLASKLFFGTLDEMATNWILSRRRYSPAADADAIVEILVNGIGGKRIRRRGTS